MTKKVKLAIFDEDLKARKVGEFDVTDGNQIKVKSGGEGHFMPTFTNYSYLEFPYRSILSPWKISWNRIYMVRKGAKKCVSFRPKNVILVKKKMKDGTEKLVEEINPDIDVAPADPTLVKDAASMIMLDRLNKQKQETNLFQYLSIALLVILLLGQFGAW